MESHINLNVYGLHEQDADLVIEGKCDLCGVALWLRRFSKAEYSRMDDEQLVEATKDTIAKDREAVRSHRCTDH